MDCASFHWEFHAWCPTSRRKWPQHFKKQIKRVVTWLSRQEMQIRYSLKQAPGEKQDVTRREFFFSASYPLPSHHTHYVFCSNHKEILP